MVAHPPLRSSFDGFLAVAAFAAAPLKPAPACGDGPAPEEPPIATIVWQAPRSSADDASTMSDDDGRLANFGPAATPDASAFRPQIVAEREGG